MRVPALVLEVEAVEFCLESVFESNLLGVECTERVFKVSCFSTKTFTLSSSGHAFLRTSSFINPNLLHASFFNSSMSTYNKSIHTHTYLILSQ
jgi:hypothetical protein